MTRFLQSNVTLVIGVGLLLALFAVRGATGDKQLRRDLRGPIVCFIGFLILRTLGWALDEHLARPWLRALRVGWMLAFAFGGVRGLVSFGLWLWRLRTHQPTPKILRDVLDATLYIVAAVPILKTQLDIDLTGLLATSAILSVVIGLALQETLGNLFSGLSLQLERPFQVGDWVSIGSHTGQVAQVAWRATRLENVRNESVTLPNNVVSKEAVKNFSRGSGVIGIDTLVDAPNACAPNQVKAVLQDIIKSIPGVLTEPPPLVRVTRFAESNIEYLVRCYARSFADRENIVEELLTRVWYRFRREGIDIPLPQQVLHILPDAGGSSELPVDAREEILRDVELFQGLSPVELEGIAKDAVPREFGAGERVLVEGAQGQTFFVVAKGEVSVRAGKLESEVARLGRGDYFGEMSLLTGDPRSATIIALRDTTLLEIDRPTFARLFEERPGLDRQLSALLAHRRAELRARAASAAEVDPTPEAGRIFGRLKQIFSR